jgi:hypothetical protein
MLLNNLAVLLGVERSNKEFPLINDFVLRVFFSLEVLSRTSTFPTKKKITKETLYNVFITVKKKGKCRDETYHF